MCLSSSNNSSAKDLATSVLPTPVGPKNMKDPIGRLGSLIPARALIIASLTSFKALSCPFTLRFKFSSKFNNFSLSPPTNLETGT